MIGENQEKCDISRRKTEKNVLILLLESRKNVLYYMKFL